MLFIDENEDQIHASAPRDLILQFRDIPTEGDIFHVEKSDISKINDIIGKLKAVTKIELVSKRNGDTSPKRDLILEIMCGSTMKITVWDDMLKEIPLDLSEMPSTPIVLIVTSTTVDMFKGVCYLKPTSATKMYYNFGSISSDSSVQMLGNTDKSTKNKGDLMLENRKELGEIFTIMDESQTE
ncbi:hypothetical protein GIB67_033960, partial [Kingdonia uniflora]